MNIALLLKYVIQLEVELTDINKQVTAWRTLAVCQLIVIAVWTALKIGGAM